MDRFGLAVDLATSESKVPVRILGQDVNIFVSLDHFCGIVVRFFCVLSSSSDRSFDFKVKGPPFESLARMSIFCFI